MIGRQVWTQSIFLGSLHTKECNNEKGGETKPKGTRLEGKIKGKGQISKQDSSANVIKAAAAMSLVSVLLAIILYNSLSII